MPADSRAPGAHAAPLPPPFGGRTPRWFRHVPLAIVVLLLLSLVMVSLGLGRRSGVLGRRFIEEVAPAHDALLRIQLSLAAQLAAIRGYQLTGESVYLTRLRMAREREAAADRRLTALALRMGPDVQRAVAVLEYRRASWAEAPVEVLEGRSTPAQLAASLASGQQRFEAALLAAEEVNAALNRMEGALVQGIGATAAVERSLVILLSLVALPVALIVGWLSRRLEGVSRDLSVRVELERELHRVAAELSASTNAQEVSDRVVRSAVESTPGIGAFLERVEEKWERVEVISSAGTGAPPPGTRAALSASVTGALPNAHDPIFLAEAGMRQTAAYLADSCPTCRALAVPLFASGGMRGSLVVLRPSDDHPFGPLEAAHLRSLADLAAPTLRRVALLERITESEERTRQIAESLREVVWISDPELTTYYYLNPAFERVWGRPVAAMYANARSFLETVHPDDLPRVELALEGYPRGEFRLRFRIVRPDGEIRWISAQAVGVSDEHGRIYRVVGTAEDITDRKRAEEERELLLQREREARAETEAALQVRDRVLRIVSHDLKNPLHTIGMTAELLEMPLPAEQRAQQIGIIRRTVDRAQQLVFDLLDAARLQSERQLTVEMEPVETGPLLAAAVEGFGLQMAQKHQRLEQELGEGAEMVMADRRRIVQVLTNLIGNAVKFTPEGGRIRVSAEPHGADAVEFTISDTGPGIAPEVIPHLFEPFTQAREGASHGTGLGLSISKGIVEAHGGEITADSAPGAGTTFRFTLPRPPA